MLLEWVIPVAILGGLLVLLISKKLIDYVFTKKQRNKFSLSGKKILEERDAKIQQFYKSHCANFPEEKIKKICSLKTLSQISESLKKGETTSEELYINFAKRIVEVAKPLNVLADVDFESGLAQARARDKERQESKDKSSFSIFHGIPISVKDQINVVGMKSTNGLIDTALNYKPSEDAVIISVFKELGAIISIKGNLPQGILGMESTNKLYGTTINPWDERRSCGGSTGGDAGLVATSSVPFALGTDFLGSLRIPPSFCGTYAYRSSSARLFI